MDHGDKVCWRSRLGSKGGWLVSDNCVLAASIDKQCDIKETSNQNSKVFLLFIYFYTVAQLQEKVRRFMIKEEPDRQTCGKHNDF